MIILQLLMQAARRIRAMRAASADRSRGRVEHEKGHGKFGYSAATAWLIRITL